MSKKFSHLISIGLIILVQQGFNGAVIGMDNKDEMSEEGFKKATFHLTCHRNQIKHAREFEAHYQKKEQGIQESVLTPTCIPCFYMGFSPSEPKNCENRKKFKEVGLYEGVKHSDPYPPRLIEKNLIEEEGSLIYVAEDCSACLKAYTDVYNYRKNAREREKNEIKNLKESQKTINIEFEKLRSQFQLLQKENKNMEEDQKNRYTFNFPPLSKENFNNQSSPEKFEDLLKVINSMIEQLNKK